MYNDFDILYKDTYNDVMKYVICKCRNIDDIPDIVQNIFVAAYKKINKDNEINKEYLMGITKNKVNDYYRFKFKDKSFLIRNEEDLSIINNTPDDIDIEKSINNKYDIELVWNYLKEKNIIIFKIFYLFYYNNMKIKDIAITLNLTESNVKHYIYRTLKEINIYLKEGDK